jgi:hypothetical protein
VSDDEGRCGRACLTCGRPCLKFLDRHDGRHYCGERSHVWTAAYERKIAAAAEKATQATEREAMRAAAKARKDAQRVEGNPTDFFGPPTPPDAFTDDTMRAVYDALATFHDRGRWANLPELHLGAMNLSGLVFRESTTGSRLRDLRNLHGYDIETRPRIGTRSDREYMLHNPHGAAA